LTVGRQYFIEQVLAASDQHITATFGEGYWVDHWTYNLDLIDSYLAVYPDYKQDLLFSSEDLPYYENPVIVRPRKKKYVLVGEQARQLGSLHEDRKKTAMIAERGDVPDWTRIGHGSGSVYRTSLFAKLFSLAVIKFATLDPWGMGIEMEAGRPGWYDALNGLPGLFGSSMPETYALNRLIIFLLTALPVVKPGRLRIPVEMMRLVRRVVKECKHHETDFSEERDYRYWDIVSSAREAYRSSIRMGLDGAEEFLTYAELKTILQVFENKVEEGINRAVGLTNGFPPTYFIYRVEEYELIKNKKGDQQSDAQGRPYIHVVKFSPKPLPAFLEGAVRALNGLDLSSAKALYKKVKDSPLYDRKLKMYKVNESLESLSQDVGRARAFTPGWLENESIWLHMEYKYLLEILRKGLYKEFFEDIRSALIPFLDPKVYGRSTQENSSFLVSSAHPDESIHGAGFVARLSGASAEFISMWRNMMFGKNPFFIIEGQLCLTLKPILPGWFFKQDNSLSCKFLGFIQVIYHNPSRYDTFDQRSIINTILLHPIEGIEVELTGDIIMPPYAQMIRDGKIRQIDVYFT
jgi:hypothetical protein